MARGSAPLPDMAMEEDPSSEDLNPRFTKGSAARPFGKPRLKRASKQNLQPGRAIEPFGAVILPFIWVLT